MYNQYYGLSANPFQLSPDPRFFFDSKGHKRAMSYLEYGLSRAEGFIIITGEVGAGKTTLVRNLLSRIKTGRVQAAHIVNTHLDPDDTVRMVAAAFALPYADGSKTVLLKRLEQFLKLCRQQKRHALLLVDEAQNLSPHTLEELRMLSNFQLADQSILQIFLLGQPEFRSTLMGQDMEQLRQRVIASYHLGPLDVPETRCYIEHRLQTVGWRGDPALSDDAFAAIHDYTRGIPRNINTLCDRLFLMGYLEELHELRQAEVLEVISDMQNEMALPAARPDARIAPVMPIEVTERTPGKGDVPDERVSRWRAQ